MDPPGLKLLNMVQNYSYLDNFSGCIHFEVIFNLNHPHFSGCIHFEVIFIFDVILIFIVAFILRSSSFIMLASCTFQTLQCKMNIFKYSNI